MSGKSRRAWKHFFYSNIFLGLVVGALIFIVINLARVYYQNNEVEEEIARLQSEAARLQAKQIETLDALKFADSPSFVEEKARTQFNLAKPGESVALLADSGSLDGDRASAEAKTEIAVSNPTKWLRVFFKK